MFSLTFQRVSVFSHFSQHVLMSFLFVKRLGFDGCSLFQQIESHLAYGVDLISVGMCQHFFDVCSDWLPSESSVSRANDVLDVSYFPWCWTSVVTACDSHETHSLIPLIFSEFVTHLGCGAKNSYDSSTT